MVGGDTNTTAGAGSPTVGQLICGTTAGCVAVYKHDVDDDDDHPTVITITNRVVTSSGQTPRLK